MGKDLLIVESPSKARTINKYLGRDYEVLASVGHIRDLPKKKFGVDIENGFEPKYVTVRGKGKVIKKLKQAAKKANEVYLAPDPDREGEAIAWHIAQVLKKNPEKVHRVLFNEITKSGVKRGLKEPREINNNLVNAQQARRILDRIVGYRVSPFLWKTLYRGLSAGRVQSVAARLICEREDEIEAFDPEEYWEMFANYITESDEKFQAKGAKFEGSKLKISNADEAKKHADAIQSADHIVEKVKVKNRKKSPAPPFTTSTLQQTATRFYHYSPKQTMSIAQKLYEGIEIKGEPVGLITYMRTDSLRISKEAINSSRKHIDEEYGDKYLPKKPRYYKQSGKNVQDAHECIRPTNLNLPPEKVAKQLSKRQLKIYSLIWKRFVACQMTPAIYKRKTIEVKAGKYLFRARGENEIFDGYLKAYRKGKSKKNSKDKKKVPEQISEKENLELKKLDKEQKFTNPPPRYTEGTLVKQLDKLGIGRPSTYASIVSTIRGRNYIVKEKGRLKPTELGRTVNDILVNQMPEIFNVEFTNQMEEDLDQIESDQRDWKE
ncbi:MAG: type I DNA topoisomerase, partial [Candidatus Marinimicrobia bacterium]|nr:type I DNA topoisomerase [Candidatus Neomarinimicrobiota bacterium]